MDNTQLSSASSLAEILPESGIQGVLVSFTSDIPIHPPLYLLILPGYMCESLYTECETCMFIPLLDR